MSAQEDAMWEDFIENGADFTIDDDEVSSLRERKRVEEAVETFGIWDTECSAFKLGFQFGKELSQEERLIGLAAIPEEDAFLADLLSTTLDGLSGLHPGGDSLDNVLGNTTGAVNKDFNSAEADTNSDCYPYPNYPTFLLDVIDNILRTPISDSLLKLFIFVMHESGVKGIPSFSGFRQLQAKLRKTCGVLTIPCTSPQGHRFFIVDPRVVLGKDWANLAIRKHMHVYPEIPDGPIREVGHNKVVQGNQRLHVKPNV
ncbi:hypothetical protein LXA43DRAFT_1065353 [Ganoderma leucocontextum]|nr:hypothetical protein LXA43DRAFT_1065353 [Ganoderma leucocontextum]